jgi:anti-anti-sigma factor
MGLAARASIRLQDDEDGPGGRTPSHTTKGRDTLATTEPNAARTQVVGRLTIEIVDAAAGPTVRLSGELGLDATAALEERLFALLDTGSQPPEVDLSELEFIDSSGLQSLLRVTRRARAQGMEAPRMVGSTGQVRRLFELTGADRALLIGD